MRADLEHSIDVARKMAELSSRIDGQLELYIMPLLFIHTGIFKCAN